MIIDCGERRLVSNRYGWMIQRRVKSKKGGFVWKEDRPAYPGSLSKACEAVLERTLTDGPDIPIGKLADELRIAAKAVKSYFEMARRIP